MSLSSLLVCADGPTAQMLRRVLEELSIRVESCADTGRAAFRLAQERFDAVIVECQLQKDVNALLHESRASRLNDSTLAVVVVEGQQDVREMFSLGVNLVLYKPLSYERAVSSLRAARSLMRKERRRAPRAAVHTQAMIDFAGGDREKATLVDLTEEGMAVNFGKRLPPTCKLYFQFALPGQGVSVRLSGQVVWQEWNGRTGIQFVDVPGASLRALRAWLRLNVPDDSEEAPSLSAVTVELQDTPLPEPAALPNPVLPTASVSAMERGGAAQQNWARMRSEPGNRRAQTRYVCRLGAEVYRAGTTIPHRCNLTDLSSGGCYLEMTSPFPTGASVEIVVRTPEQKLKLVGKAQSAHPGYGMGVAFTLKTEDERKGVQQLIDFVAATAEQL
jgi:DNA-binding NarL/FixJ family response regulator